MNVSTKSLLSALLCLSISLSACNSDSPDSSQPTKSRSIEITAAEKAVSTANNRFAWHFLDETLTNTKTNTVLSPLSANFCLSMLANAANGDSRTQLLDALGYDDADMADVNSLNHKVAKDICKLDNKVTVNVANSFWYDADIRPKADFLSDMKINYAIESFVIKPSTFVKDVNNWCAKKTNGLIPKILDDNELKAFALINALYFKGFWKDKFSKNLTTQRIFHNADGSEDNHEYMCDDSRDCEYFSTQKWHAARLPFGGGGYIFTVVLPYEQYTVKDCIESIAEVEPATSGDFSIATLNLMIPKYEIDCETDMIDILKHMGVTDIFNEYQADLSAMTDQQVFVDLVKQHVNFKIDESGAEAAAVTIAGGTYASLPQMPKIDFKVDRPFIYMISERSTGAILFAGCINKF